MNYLAHAFLSFDNKEVLVGNLVSDFVKGKKKFEYPAGILAGIDLHRAIDRFTDDHPVNRDAAEIFRPAYGRYSAAFMDIVYDHFLAKQLAEAGPEDFERFTAKVYRQVSEFNTILPETFRAIFPYMQQHDWLFNYQFDWGIKKSFEGLVRRAAYLTESDQAFDLFKENYEKLQSAYEAFLPQVINFSLEKFSDIH